MQIGIFVFCQSIPENSFDQPGSEAHLLTLFPTGFPAVLDVQVPVRMDGSEFMA